MKKSVMLSALLVCSAVLFAGCGTKGESESGMVTYASGEVVLGEYKGITYKDTLEEVTDKEIEDETNKALFESKGKDKEITDRPVETGDIVNIDYEGFVDGVAFENGKDEKFDLTIGSNQFIKGFEEGLIGASKGAEVEVNVTFPDPYQNPDLAGKDAVFKVKVNSIKQIEYPELTDELVAKETDSKTVEEYKENMRQELMDEKKEQADKEKSSEVMMKVIENATFKNDLTKEIEAYKEIEKQYWENLAQANYGTDAKSYFQQAMGYDEAKYEEFIKTISTNTVKQQKVLNAVVEAEALTLTDEEYTKGLEQYMAQSQYENKEEFLKQIGGEEKLKNVLLLNKAQEFITNNAVAE